MQRDERGSATLLTIAAIVIVLTVAGAAMLLIGYVGAVRRAGQAADLAAVSAAQTVAFGEPGCPVAERITRENSARLTDCEQVGDALEFAVTVDVQIPVHPAFPGLPSTVSGRASAGQLDV